VADHTSSTGNELQFERVVTDQLPPATNGSPAVTCAACQTRLEDEYYEINGRTFCGDCRGKIEAVAETPRGLAPLGIAAIFGLGAAVAGAAIYYAVIAITHFEIGLIAILIGYMVGYAVRRGAGGRGGLRFQILAAVLTYGAVGLAYGPLMLAERAVSPATLVAVAVMTPILPILIVIGTMPSGVITALIIFFGIRQAMRMTAAPVVAIRGPFRIGTPSNPSTSLPSSASSPS